MTREATTTARAVGAHEQRRFELLEKTLSYARARQYTGWDYGDGMSSRILRALPVDNKWVNVAFQETIKRAPVNVRPLFLVEQRRNYKGAGLFAMANQTTERLRRAAKLRSASPGVDYDAEARDLADWLVENRSTGYSGYCGGHNHQIQLLDGRGYPNDPDVVSTSFAVKALLRAERVGADHASLARTASDFVTEDLHYRSTDAGAVFNYHTNHPDDYYTINAGALGARLFLDLYAAFGDRAYRRRARELLDHVATLQDDGGWYYREPADASHLSKDNHHNGFIIECFQRYRDVVGDGRYEDVREAALRFYRNELFDGHVPNFDEASAYPRDIHAATQGILVFTYAGDLEFADGIVRWVLDDLYAGDGQFYYRKERFYTRRYTLMRWCQAWMAYALSEYLAVRLLRDESSDHGPTGPP